MTLGVPISFSVGIASVVATLLLPGVDNATIVQRMLTSLNTFPLLAVIFFVFAGTLMALAGVIPGVLIGISLMAASFVHGRLYHRKVLPQLSQREKVRRVFDGMAGAFTMVIILGGILAGVFTATEAGAAACVYAMLLTVFVYKEIKWRDLPEIIWQCCLTNAVVMLLIATCSVFSWMLTYDNLPRMLADNC